MGKRVYKQSNNLYCLFCSNSDQFFAFNSSKHQIVMALLSQHWSPFDIRQSFMRLERGHSDMSDCYRSLSMQTPEEIEAIIESGHFEPVFYHGFSLYQYPIKQPNGLFCLMNDVEGYPSEINLTREQALKRTFDLWGEYFNDNYLNALFEQGEDDRAFDHSVRRFISFAIDDHKAWLKQVE